MSIIHTPNNELSWEDAWLATAKVGDIEKLNMLLKISNYAIPSYILGLAFSDAAENNNYEIVHYMWTISRGDILEWDVGSAFLNAVRNGNYNIAKYIGDNAIDKIPQYDLYRAFSKAAWNDNYDLIKYILEISSSSQISQYKISDALTGAARNDNVQIAQLILEDIEISSLLTEREIGHSFFIATHHNNVAAANYILDAVEHKIDNLYLNNAFSIACSYGHLQIATKILALVPHKISVENIAELLNKGNQEALKIIVTQTKSTLSADDILTGIHDSDLETIAACIQKTLSLSAENCNHESYNNCDTYRYNNADYDNYDIAHCF